MAPEERRSQILDVAVHQILDSGHSTCSLEQVAEAAGISKALIYRYFRNREELLEALLKREFRYLRGSGLASVASEAPIEQVIRATVERAMRYYAERGPIIRLLAADPAVAQAARQGNRASVSATIDYFVRRSVEHYGVPEDVAIIAVTLVVDAPIHAMAQLRRRQIDLDQTIDVWCNFIIAGWEGLRNSYAGGADSSGGQ
jgi:AcrR family transcriptional regulator